MVGADQVQRLSRIPFLAALSEEELESLANSLRRRRFPRHEVIFHQDDPGNCLYIVVSGSVKIVRRSEDGRELILSLIAPGEYFGELSLFDGEPRSADAVAAEASELLLLPRESFLGLLQRTPETAIRMLASLSRQYVRRLTDVVEEAIFLDVSARLARVLLHVAEERTKHETGVRLTQNDLASMAGASRESVNKWLGYFERRGWLKRERGDVLLLDPDALAAYSARE